ncbi:MAG: PEP-CTERM sorting domain-containing protein [Phycisphaerae bacterium]|nr:PEP-CTERM sorting domain-containing protein [Phycisphaerae bacterium]MDP7636077.1 PEP-CTERM sorting domain-containing protein [Phycisphaerae bacterium]
MYKLALVMMLLFGVAGMANGETLLSAGFEVSGGYSDASGSDVELAPQIYGGGSNQLEWYSQFYIYPTSAASGQFMVTNDLAATGTQSVKFLQPSYYYNYLRHKITEKSTGIVTAQWAQYLQTVDTAVGRNTNSLQVELLDGYDTSDAAYGPSPSKGPGGLWSGYNDRQSQVSAASPDSYTLMYGTDAYPLDRKIVTSTSMGAEATWVTYKTVLDLDAGTYDFYADSGSGLVLVDSDAIREGSVGEGFTLDVISFTEFGAGSSEDANNTNYFYNPTTFAYIDDILVTWVPEPVTMALLTLGGLGVLIRRKRR